MTAAVIFLALGLIGSAIADADDLETFCWVVAAVLAAVTMLLVLLNVTEVITCR